MELGLLTVLALLASGFAAGTIGALVGIGGGVLLVPLLVLGFGVPMKIAVATSLVSVIATSTAAGSVWVGKGLANMRLGMTLEMTTTLGGIAGGLVAASVAPGVLSGLFSVLMAFTALLLWRAKEQQAPSSGREAGPEGEPTGHEERGRLAGSYYDGYSGRVYEYRVERLPLGSAVSFVAGVLSGMLGVGGGFMKVPAMTLVMGVPIKVAAATSNFTIGITAVSSLFVYLDRGFVHPLLAAPVALGVVGGALLGTKLAKRFSPKRLRQALCFVLVAIAVQMALKTAGVNVGR